MKAVVLCMLLPLTSLCVRTAWSQTPSAPPSDAPAAQGTATPPGPGSLKQHPEMTDAEKAEALRISKLAIINGKPYDQPSELDKFLDYANDTYGVPGITRSTLRAGYSQLQGGPVQWPQDWTGFGQREGSSLGTTAISGTVRYGFSVLFHEDLRYLPCHGCSAKKKLENVLLSEITARHDENGHRFFTLTPTIGDFSGPIIAHQLWYPGSSAGPIAGVVSARTLFAARIGQHLFEEFVWERRHHDPKFEQ